MRLLIRLQQASWRVCGNAHFSDQLYFASTVSQSGIGRPVLSQVCNDVLVEHGKKNDVVCHSDAARAFTGDIDTIQTHRRSFLNSPGASFVFTYEELFGLFRRSPAARTSPRVPVQRRISPSVDACQKAILAILAPSSYPCQNVVW